MNCLFSLAVEPPTGFRYTADVQFYDTTLQLSAAMPSMHLSQVRRWLLQSPPVEWGITQLREVLIGALRHGPIPQHVAFVMDGNRRFARTHGIETVEGHNLGFEALARVRAFVDVGRYTEGDWLTGCDRSLKSVTSLALKS